MSGESNSYVVTRVTMLHEALPCVTMQRCNSCNQCNCCHQCNSSSERHLRRCLLFRLLNNEELGRSEVERPGNHVGRERLALRVVSHDGVVVGLPGERHFILSRGELF